MLAANAATLGNKAAL